MTPGAWTTMIGGPSSPIDDAADPAPRGRVPARFDKEIPMSVESLIIFLLVGAVAGWLAGTIVRGYGFGLVGNIVVGIVGAFLAGWLLPRLGVNLGLSGIVGAIIFAAIGAIVLLLLIGLIRRAT
jgi:uncharacterized membrane protein YeaQ/YmgE (transglycosylase-associated protein family)